MSGLDDYRIVMTLLLITGKELDENGVGDDDDSRSADWF